jgi:hypothetical protein
MIKYSRYIPPSDAEENRTSDLVTHGDMYGGMDEYFAHDDSGKAIAMAKISHDPGYTSTSVTTHNPDTGEDTLITEGQRAHDTNLEDWSSWHKGMTRPAQAGEQLVLFGVNHRPARSEVHELYARNNMSGKTAAMNLIGMADIASTTTTGKHLKPSNSLSLHSRALVSKLNKYGAISDEDMPSKIQDNDFSFNYAENKLNRYPRNNQIQYQDLNSRIPHARARIRGVLGKPTRELGPQFTQMQFEGFE